MAVKTVTGVAASSLLHTIGGQDVGSIIRFELDDEESEDYTYSNATLNTVIAKAVQLYSRYKAFTRKGTLTTVVDQELYVLPTDCTRLARCEYRTGQTNEYGELNQYYPWLFEGWDSPSLTAIRNQLVAAYDEVGMGMWTEINYPQSYMGGRYVWLYPAPAQSGDSITIWYTTEHTLVSTDYPTIPASHAQHLQDLVVAMIDLRDARQALSGVLDYNAGQTRMRRGSGPQSLYQNARLEIRRILRALGTTVASRGYRTYP